MGAYSGDNGELQKITAPTGIRTTDLKMFFLFFSGEFPECLASTDEQCIQFFPHTYRTRYNATKFCEERHGSLVSLYYDATNVSTVFLKN